jgi:hypothetical protein
MSRDTPIAEILMLLGDMVVELHERDKEIRRLTSIIDEQRKVIQHGNEAIDNNG